MTAVNLLSSFGQGPRKWNVSWNAMVLKSNTDLLLFVTPNAIGKEEKSATFYRLNIFIIQLFIY